MLKFRLLCLGTDSPLSPPSIRWSATSACLKAAQGHTARRETCGHTRRHTGANTHSCVINRAVERPSSLLTASRSMFVSTPRRNHLSAMCKAVKRPSTRCTGECTLSEHILFLMILFVKINILTPLCSSSSFSSFSADRKRKKARLWHSWFLDILIGYGSSK